MATFPVKYLHSGMRGAPALSGTVATLVALLDAFLIDGFGQVTLTSLVVSGGVATATVNAGDSFEAGSVITLAGATPTVLNGEQRVSTMDSTHFTFPTTAQDGAATGTITAKYAPVAGWEKSFSGTNKAVYRSIDPQANGHYLRVDDSGASSAAYARVRGFESMTDVDTGSGPFPVDALMSDGWYWHKSASANAAAVPWKAFGDSRFLILAIAGGVAGFGANGFAAPAIGFGDAIPLAGTGDGWATVLAGAPSGYNNIFQGALDRASGSTPTVCVPRQFGGVGSAINAGFFVYGVNPASSTRSGDMSVGNGGMGEFPSAVDGRLLLLRMAVYDKSGAAKDQPRGLTPGVYFAAHDKVSTVFADGDSFIGAGELAGRRLVAVATHDGFGYTSPTGRYFVDVTGPWRE